MTINLNDFEEKNIVVTGCAGFIGSHISESLVNIGANVIGIDNFYNGLMKNIQNFKHEKNFE